MDEALFDRWRQYLDVVKRCADTAKESRHFGFAWRAIVCAYGAELPAPDLLHWGLSGAADPPFNHFATSLTVPEVVHLYFCSDVRQLFCDLQIDWFSDPSVPENTYLILPTANGDLSSTPGIVHVVHSPDFGQWLQVMTGGDETLVDGPALFQHLYDTAALKQESHSVISLSAQRVDHSQSSLQGPTRGTVRLADLVERSTAEVSLRNILGDHVYYSLLPQARNAAITAEYCWLDPNFPDPSKIVSELATAFERQLRDGVLRPFCEALVASGASNYPEPDGAQSSGPVQEPGQTPVPGRPRFPKLLIYGRMNDRLNLELLGTLLRDPLPRMVRYFSESGLKTADLAQRCRQVANRRNPAVHQGQITREEAEDIRREWLGLDDRGSSIFAGMIIEGKKFSQ